MNLVLTLKEVFKCRYQMKLVYSGAMQNRLSPAFFSDPHNVFISGLLKNKRGTCSSYPVLIAALGRRLGYPIFLKATPGHIFCVWSDGKETFNIDTNGTSVDTPLDEHYYRDPVYGIVSLGREECMNERYMLPLSNWDCFGFFIEIIGYCYEARNNLEAALRFYNLALQYRPQAKNLRRLANRKPTATPPPSPNPLSSPTS